MANYTNELFDFAYSSERSIEDGIQELSDAEMGTVIISYVVMFVYITIALGKFKGFRNLLVSGNIWTQSGGRTGMAIIKNLTFLISFRPLRQMESKIILAVGGIIVVLGAVGCSLGFFGYLGVTTTMLTIEVSGI